MKPAGIKQITTEMVIAWGMICIGFIVYDNITHRLGISPFFSIHPSICYKGVGFVASQLILLSSVPSMLVLIAIPFKIPGMFLNNSFIVVFQFFLYWYVGNLIGRFFAWIYIESVQERLRY